MSDRQKLVDQLIVHESERLFPYMDTVGKITIGVGRNLSDVGISHAESMLFLDHDINDCLTDLVALPWFVVLDPVRQRVIMDMRFNLGPSRLRNFKRMIRLLGDHDYVKAGAAMRDSVWARQVKTRADRLIRMMVTGEDYLP